LWHTRVKFRFDLSIRRAQVSFWTGRESEREERAGASGHCAGTSPNSSTIVARLAPELARAFEAHFILPAGRFHRPVAQGFAFLFGPSRSPVDLGGFPGRLSPVRASRARRLPLVLAVGPTR
jgi:hypothetical protein